MFCLRLGHLEPGKDDYCAFDAAAGRLKVAGLRLTCQIGEWNRRWTSNGHWFCSMLERDGNLRSWRPPPKISGIMPVAIDPNVITICSCGHCA